MDIPTALAHTVTGNHEQVKEATKFLTDQEKQTQFVSVLLQLITSATTPPHVRHATGIYFKNYVLRYWPINENQDWTIPKDMCQLIKQNMVGLMVNTPEIVQKQIVDCLELISMTDFPADWPEILPELVKQTGESFQAKNFEKATNLLKATNSLLRRYRTIAHDNEQVNKELAFVLQHLLQPVVQEFQFCSELIAEQSNNPAALKVIFEILHQLFKLFYCMTYVTLPEAIEDNMDLFMKHHMMALTFSSQSDELLGDDDDRPGILLKVQATVCQNICVFIQKYEEEFEKYIGDFVQAVWNLLTKIEHEQAKYDRLLARGMLMLTNVSKGVSHKLLEKEEILQQICDKIIIPNLTFREVDEINFEEEHLEYIRTDLEESNQLTRRSSACELVQGLRKHNEAAVTKAFAEHVMKQLAEYNQNKKENWKKKDVAFFLISALTISGGTRVQGVTSTNELVPVIDFLKDQVVPELQQYPDNHPVIQADTLKFLITFRNQIPKEFYAPIFQCALKMLGSNEYVVNTYAASCMERLLTVKDGNTFRFGAADLKPFTNDILKLAFGKLSQEASQNNDYIMRLVMRVLSVSKGDIIEFAQPIMEQLQAIIMRIAKNPTIPAFDHYVFESVACLCSCLHAKDPTLVTQFETQILPTMATILQNDTANFSPYVYQLLSMFLELNPTGSFNNAHKEILENIISPAAWAETGNIPALTRLVEAYLRKDINSIIQMEKFTAILGVFQNLLSFSLQDHHGMEILNVILEVTPKEAFSSFIEPIFTVIFKRLTSKKTTKLCCEFTLFLCRFVHKYTLPVLHEILEKITPGILNNVLSLWETSLLNFGKQSDVQVATIMTASILVEPLLTDNAYAAHWLPLAKGLAFVMFNVNKSMAVLEESDLFEKQKNQQLGLQTSFAKLVHSSTSVTVDPFIQQVSQIDRNKFVVDTLRPFVMTNAQALQPLLQQLAADKNGAQLCALLQ